MKFIKNPVKGMPEQMPNDMILRDYVTNLIKQTYYKYGFSLIETPVVEHIENLTNKQGGENEQLIFKVLKRGEKLEQAHSIEELCDSGLRYDLTVPLSRFYSNNMSVLPVPFKAFQIGSVFRADRPQKGRFRQFTQCDIDILGDSSNLAEIELITATSNMLVKLGIDKLKVIINDRHILRAMALSCNFPEDKLDTIYIILDKMNKIGLDGVKQELIDLGLNENDVSKYCDFFKDINDEIEIKEFIGEKLNGYLEDEVVENLNQIINSTRSILNENCKIVFDPTLVRGMSYYTGPIFEIELQNYHLSVAGGGRYDKMIGKYCGTDVCACGFSIGFERIIEVLKETKYKVENNIKSTAILIAKDVDSQKVNNVLVYANKLRENGERVLISSRNKNVKFQKNNLIELGYNNFIDVFNDTDL